MNINDLLNEIDIEIARMSSNYKSFKSNKTKNNNDMICKLSQVESSFGILKKGITELKSRSKFTERIKIKKDLKDLMKLLQSEYSKEELRALIIKQAIDKLNVKYKLKTIETDKNNKLNVAPNVSSTEKEDEFYKNLQEKIAKSYKRAEEQKRKSGIKCDEPVQIISISEVKESAERARKIECAKAKAKEKKVLLQKQQEDDIMVVTGITKKIKSIMKEKQDLQLDDTINIRYELQNNNYYINGKQFIHNPKRYTTKAQKEKFIKSKLKCPADFDYIFDKSSLYEANCLKKCDPYIITILALKDIKLARDYVKKAAGTSTIRKSNNMYNIIYDVRGLESIPKKELSFFDKLKLRKTVKYIKRTSTVIEDRKKLPWYATIPVISALAISAISGGVAAFNNNSNRNNEDSSLRNNSYSDSVNPGKTKVADVATTETTRLDESISSTNKTESNITTSSTNNAKKQNQTTTTPKEVEKEEDNNEKSIVINIGDKINVSDGVEYTANCLGGGNSNKIGEVSWRPATDYSVDKVAFCYDGKILGVMSTGEGDVKQTLNKYATQYEIDVNQINTSVLLSLVPGSGDTGWAQISIDDMEKNISKPIQDLDSKVQTHESSEIDR